MTQINVSSGGSRISEKRGAIIWPFFSEKLHENEEIWREGSLTLTLRSDTDSVIVFNHSDAHMKNMLLK